MTEKKICGVVYCKDCEKDYVTETGRAFGITVGSKGKATLVEPR